MCSLTPRARRLRATPRAARAAAPVILAMSYPFSQFCEIDVSLPSP